MKRLSGRLLASPTNIRELEKLARDKHSSLLQKFVHYDSKKFYRIGPWENGNLLFAKIFYLNPTTKIRIIIIMVSL